MYITSQDIQVYISNSKLIVAQVVVEWKIQKQNNFAGFTHKRNKYT